jgi:lipopolysaccharide/colanic/teichoic acid biosynthesis glycosyltransferase
MPDLMGRTIAAAALIVLSPLITALALAVRLTSPGPAFHRARRVGPHGEFTLHKLRTMRSGAATAGPGVTAAGDARVTRLGRVLRRTKLDELPQLWDVVRGEMALVGPRPEDPRYVDPTDPLHRVVFAARPGITGPTALAYRNEEATLAAAALDVARADGRDRATDADLDRAYRETVLPAKLTMDADYLRTRSTRSDLAILGRTIGQVLGRTTRQ